MKYFSDGFALFKIWAEDAVGTGYFQTSVGVPVGVQGEPFYRDCNGRNYISSTDFMLYVVEGDPTIHFYRFMHCSRGVRYRKQKNANIRVPFMGTDYEIRRVLRFFIVTSIGLSGTLVIIVLPFTPKPTHPPLERRTGGGVPSVVKGRCNYRFEIESAWEGVRCSFCFTVLDASTPFFRIH